MRTLVVFYSLTGTTKRVAHDLAAALGADLEEIQCPAHHPGFLGFWRAGYASWKNRIAEISPARFKPSDYDLVLVGGPVWAWNACTPVRAYLAREAAHLPALGLFATAGGAGFEQAFATMERIAGRKPVVTLALQASDFKQGRDQDKVAAFMATLRQGKAA